MILCGQKLSVLKMFVLPVYYFLAVAFNLLFILLIVKLYFKRSNGTCHSNADLTGKTVLITGGNTGIGKEYVRDIARRNATVIMACRNEAKANECAREISKESNNNKIYVEKLDLSSLESVVCLCNEIKQKHSKIDILVCFAAAVSATNTHTDDGLETQFQCNYLSHFLMIHLLIDLLLKSEDPRIILTSSSAQMIGKVDLDNISRFEQYSRNTFFAYADSKLALVILAKELSKRLSKSNVCVNSFHPGTVLTNGIKNNRVWYIKYFLTFLAFIYGKSIADGAQSMIYLSVSEQVKGVTGQFFADCEVAPYNRVVDDDKLRLGLWNLSVHLVKPFLNNINEHLI